MITEQDINKKVEQTLKQFMNEEGKANILVVGATGVGKSTLVNKIFNVDFAKVGVGKPVTQETTKYEVEGIPINLFDTKGYEISSDEHQRFLNEMQSYMMDELKAPEDQIHIVWYCISASNSRITDMDLEMIEKFKATGKPICVVLTKTDLISGEDLQGLQNILEENNITNFYVSTKADQFENFQLKPLIEWTFHHIDESVKWAFLRSQKANLDLKKQEVNKAIRQHAIGSFAVGFSPIPFSDGPILIANQTAMIGRILHQYGLVNVSEQMTTIIGSLGIGNIISNLGRFVAGQILKFIPGIGTIAGGVINGTVATAITVSLGLTVSEIAYQVAKQQLKEDGFDIEKFIQNNFSSDTVKSIFTSILDQEMKKK